jgi:hypothetical protein
MSKSRNTADVFDEQDQLSRAYNSTTEPEREKDRLADVWIQADGTSKANAESFSTSRLTPLMVYVRKHKPFTKLNDLKKKAN